MSSQSPDVKPGDVVIPVIGASGAGKSFFINTLLRRDEMEVYGGLGPCTKKLGFGYMERSGLTGSANSFRVVAVDTRGFNVSEADDLTILSDISTWLEDSYKQGAKLGGVIYIHDITSPRFDGPAHRALQIFRALCGDGPLDSIALVSTKWDLNIPDSRQRQSQLVRDCWKGLIARGARVYEVGSNHDIALEVIEPMIKSSTNGVSLRFQKAIDVAKAISPTHHQRFESIKAALRQFFGLFRRG